MSTDTPFVDSSHLLNDVDKLRARASEDGYLFFKGLIPRGDVIDVRRDLLGVVQKHGWLAGHPDPLSGTLDTDALVQIPAEAMRLDIGVSTDAYNDVQRLESVHRLPHHPRLLELYRTLFGEAPLVHPRHIVRMVAPHPSMVPTPQHQDFPLIQGAENTWTCWFPVGDCPREMGGLTVLRGSHRLGYLPIANADGAGGITAQTCPWEDEWVSGDFEAGDVLTFPAFTVHKALPSLVRDRIRLSMDVRYQPLSEPVESKSLRPHCSLSWEEIYEGWRSDELQWYWSREALSISQWDPALMQPSRRIC